MSNVFAIPIFFVCLRESLETGIIISILLAFLKQTLAPGSDRATYGKLVRQIWWGAGLGLLLCLCVGAGMIGAFYGLGSDHWASTEDLWEGIFSLIASVVITVMGAALLRVSKLQDKWRVKLAKALEAKDGPSIGTRFARFKTFCEKYAMFILPFVTVLREGLEAVVFIGGVSLGVPATSIPLAVVSGLGIGCLVGFFVYKGGNLASIQLFLIVSTCFLYLVSAGLFSKGVWFLETNAWNKLVGGDAAESGSGPGSYDIRQSVWHVNINGGGGWGVFNSLLGWQNSATYGSVISYNLYWLVVIATFLSMAYNEKHGHWPLMKAKPVEEPGSDDSPGDDETVVAAVVSEEKTAKDTSAEVKSLSS